MADPAGEQSAMSAMPKAEPEKAPPPEAISDDRMGLSAKGSGVTMANSKSASLEDDKGDSKNDATTGRSMGAGLAGSPKSIDEAGLKASTSASLKDDGGDTKEQDETTRGGMSNMGHVGSSKSDDEDSIFADADASHEDEDSSHDDQDQKQVEDKKNEDSNNGDPYEKLNQMRREKCLETKRLSARRRRKRQKDQLLMLEQRLLTLTKERKGLLEANEALRMEVTKLASELTKAHATIRALTAGQARPRALVIEQQPPLVLDVGRAASLAQAQELERLRAALAVSQARPAADPLLTNKVAADEHLSRLLRGETLAAQQQPLQDSGGLPPQLSRLLRVRQELQDVQAQDAQIREQMMRDILAHQGGDRGGMSIPAVASLPPDVPSGASLNQGGRTNPLVLDDVIGAFAAGQQRFNTAGGLSGDSRRELAILLNQAEGSGSIPQGRKRRRSGEKQDKYP